MRELTASGFNPTRVRLKPPSKLSGRGVIRLQPHKGTSETTVRVLGKDQEFELQPHKGTSETPRRGGASTARPCFNPTRVRLKPRERYVCTACGDASTPQGYV